MTRCIGDDDGGPAWDGEEEEHSETSCSNVYVNGVLSIFIFSATIRGPPATNAVPDEDVLTTVRFPDTPATADFFYDSQRVREQASRDETTRGHKTEACCDKIDRTTCLLHPKKVGFHIT